MNTYGTSAICPCCGKTLYTSNIPKYSFVCKDCNKNFYTKEVKDTFAEYWDAKLLKYKSELNFKNQYSCLENQKEDGI